MVKFAEMKRPKQKKMSLCANITRAMLYGAMASLPFAACAQPAATAIAPAYTATPLPTSPPIVYENPISQFYDTFFDTANAGVDAIHVAGKGDRLQDMMEARSFLQSLQELFYPATTLVAAQNDDYWSGMLFGAIDGSGVIEGDARDAAFTCQLYAGGRITGGLKDDALWALWEKYYKFETPAIINEITEKEQDGEYREYAQAKIYLKDARYYAMLHREDIYRMMVCADDMIYFCRDVPEEIVARIEYPEEWADWCFDGARIYDLEHLEQSAEGEEGNEL
ncbi:MAG: hypothetical protein LBS18_05845 [Clostridiales bacterium]|jgi:hypothetical protein|nr:hypothetical protein [Clostridiales bacterium]